MTSTIVATTAITNKQIASSLDQYMKTSSINKDIAAPETPMMTEKCGTSMENR